MSLQFSCNIIAGTESTQLPCIGNPVCKENAFRSLFTYKRKNSKLHSILMLSDFKALELVLATSDPVASVS
ncbi:hypothetical protein RHGRI_034230 [Rhododendron griersonianum]|uniref:Uncharacterized protein n=1 Tax=Rhododendron griersonianum TaxID=479676 RepID=A0AAV6I308_9ERIC|nr:hypothetical protein RHGRI_034230 [Rhododendron griersonianum]